MQANQNNLYYCATSIALILALIVIMLGAYTRLSDAGLGCPDWPGCYGKLVLPHNKAALAKAQHAFPKQPIVPAKAWTEMVHRYLAGALGLFIGLLAIGSMARRRKDPTHALFIPCVLVGLVIFQIILGMWTVTMKVLPLVVTGHLMGGMGIAALLSWLRLSAHPKHKYPSKKSWTSKQATRYGLQTACLDPLTQPLPQGGEESKVPEASFGVLVNYSHIKPWVILGLIILALQIFLGAWTSTNYAALVCPNFPFCHGTFLPHLDWRNAFNFASPIGPNYEGGHLSMNARITIQMVHRYGAFMTVAFWLPFALYLAANKMHVALRRWGWLILALLGTQFLLGVLNVVTLLPMPIAVSHNGVAALFLIAVVAFLHKMTKNY